MTEFNAMQTVRMLNSMCEKELQVLAAAPWLPGAPRKTISSEIHKQVELGGHVTDRAAAGKGGHRVRFEVWLFTGLAETKQD